jgi:hypothetical protein
MTSKESRGPALTSLREGATQDANIVRATRTVSTRHQFMNSLGVEGAPHADQPNSIRSLPLDRRAEPLAALALRINRLPYHDRLEMNRQFLNAFNTIPEQNRTPDLTALANVAAYSDSADRFITPASVVWRGANVSHTALFYNMHGNQEAIRSLELEAADSNNRLGARRAMLAGATIEQVIERFGFTHPDARRALELTYAQDVRGRQR